MPTSPGTPAANTRRDLLIDPDFPIEVKGRPTWQPGYRDVASQLTLFIRDVLGIEVEEFSDATAIKAEHVARCIYDATDEVALYVGLVPDKAAGFAKMTAAIGAAATAVRGIDPDLSKVIIEEFERRLKSLHAGIGMDNKRGPDGQLPDLGKRPRARHTFPPPYRNGGLTY